LHEQREAVCRCPRCSHFYCRECVTEHEGQFVCSACLRALAAPKHAAASRWRVARWIFAPALFVAAFLVAWIFFYSCGQLLLASFSPHIGK
jgi:hypothetical protein